MLVLMPAVAMGHGHRPRESIRDCLAIQELAVVMGEDVAKRVTAASKSCKVVPKLPVLIGAAGRQED